MKAYLRELETTFHIRFVDRNNPDHPEFTESFDKDIYSKKDVESKINHINHKIKFKDYDPWQEKEKQKRDKKKKQPLGKLIDDFVKDKWEAGGWSASTKKSYIERLRRLKQGLGAATPIGDISQQDAQQWLTDRDVSAITKDSHSSEYNYFFKWLFQNGYTDEQWRIGATPIEKKEIRNNSKIKYLTYQQLKNVERGYRWYFDVSKRCGYINHSYSPDKHPDAWWFMFWQMLRKSELPKITHSDVAGNHLQVKGKGDKKDWIYIVPPAQKIIRRKLKEIPEGRPLFDIKHKSTLYKNFRKVCQLALGEDHPTGLHQLRHGGAVHYISIGKPVQFVSKMLRHEDITITLKVYADVLEDSLEGVFEDVEDRPAS